jgi:hypothetical protein
MDGRFMIDQQQFLAELARAGSENRRETALVVSPGARVGAWAVKVKNHVGYNVYHVRAVVIGDVGSMPVEIGDEMEAVNLAESFLAQGTLAAGKYALMCRVGEKNLFHVVP